MDKEELGKLYPIVLTEYDPAWPARFEKEKEILVSIWGPALAIEHIGSTAVPGLSAKPTIDILMEKPRQIPDEHIISTMVQHGYLHMREQTQHLMFVKGYGIAGLEKESFHIHVGPLGQKWLWDRIYFREYLKRNTQEAQRYEMLKKRLAAEYRNDREAYTAGKAEYIETITEMAKRELQQ